ncbi:uncharacterized protein LOC127239363 [Andrographis paniculata]|uniref:uncharacterized protein LOC127239363 n=1 Tax=Andrographis paniculata TaxID=175694 RepID=UPI0021E8880B|nr:uncharacterized protein LOC127239363 [Andrographis paniculata]
MRFGKNVCIFYHANLQFLSNIRRKFHEFAQFVLIKLLIGGVPDCCRIIFAGAGGGNMYGSGKMKRVTAELDNKVKARIVGEDRSELDYVTSGSEYSGGGDDNVVSLSLPELFFDFSARDVGESSLDSGDRDSVSECESSIDERCLRFVDLIKPILLDRTDEFKNVLADEVSKAVRRFASVESDKRTMRRYVMAALRDLGYNAGICKTHWERSGGITAGKYEFIDVLEKNCSSARYFVDLNFPPEFEIARPTNSYEHLLQHLPAVFVGTADDLKQIVKSMSDAARISLRFRGLHLPPWRKNRFLQNKWFGSYRRTTNLFPATANQTNAVMYFAVGFDSAVNDGRLAR